MNMIFFNENLLFMFEFTTGCCCRTLSDPVGPCRTFSDRSDSAGSYHHPFYCQTCRTCQLSDLSDLSDSVGLCRTLSVGLAVGPVRPRLSLGAFVNRVCSFAFVHVRSCSFAIFCRLRGTVREQQLFVNMCSFVRSSVIFANT